jgi:cysteine desulfurase
MSAVAPIYLDHAATTPLCEAARAAMLPWLGPPANPHSAHRHGRLAHAAIETARAEVAALAGAAAPAEIAFTSGATEANNWAILGALTAPGQTRRRIVTVATEHSAVLESCRHLATLGAELVELGVDARGLIRLDEAAAAITPDTALVSIMLVNNETGVIQPVAEVAQMARAAGALMHCDAAQAAGKLPVDAAALGVDLLSLSAHKLYGPAGIGALWRRPGVCLAPLLHGGGQEAGRSGTLPVALIAGFGAAARAARAEMGGDAARLAQLGERLRAALPAHRLNGAGAPRWPGILSLSFDVPDGNRLLGEVTRRVSLSSGAACAAAKGRDSHVLAAMGLDRNRARATLRIGLGRFTTEAEVDEAAAVIAGAVAAQASAAA